MRSQVDGPRGQENATSRVASKRGSADSTMADASEDGGPRLQRQRVGLGDITNQMQTSGRGVSRGAGLPRGAAGDAVRTRSMSTRASSGDEMAHAASMSVDGQGRPSIGEAVSSGVAAAELGLGATAVPTVGGAPLRAPPLVRGRQTRSMRGTAAAENAAADTVASPREVQASEGNSLRVDFDCCQEGLSCPRCANTTLITSSVIDIDRDTADIDNVENYAVEYVNDIYEYFREKEASPRCRPSTSYMADMQPEINEGMRGILVDWLVEVAEEYRLVPDTLYLSVAYIDRYLSQSHVRRSRLQLVGVTCMLLAAKYEEIYAPEVREFCYITDNTYTANQVLECERKVLDTLNFELTQPTAKSFLRRFIRAAEAHTRCVRTHYLADYLCELTLLDYNFLTFLPSQVAASVVYLANYTMRPHINPWSQTLLHYTRYTPSELAPCIRALYEFWRTEVVANGRLPAIREKYSHARFRSVAADIVPPVQLLADI